MTEPTNSFEYWKDRCQFQIGQCRILVNLTETEKFYKSQPRIIENCLSEDCKYYQDTIIQKQNRLFDLLKKMKVDLSRQPNTIPQGLHIVHVHQNKVGYIGFYYVFGELKKTTKKRKVLDENGEIIKVSFNDAEFGDNIQVTINRIDIDKLSFDFYLEDSKE